MDRRTAHCGDSSSGGHCSLLLLSHSQIADVANYMSQFCQLEYVLSDSDVGTPCDKRAVAKCADCGSSICSDCSFDCCGDSFCGQCHDHHLTHACMRKPVQNERSLLSDLRVSEGKISPAVFFNSAIRFSESAFD
jgi:hypothetical protein